MPKFAKRAHSWSTFAPKEKGLEAYLLASKRGVQNIYQNSPHAGSDSCPWCIARGPHNVWGAAGFEPACELF